MSVGYGHAFDSEMMLLEAAGTAITGDTSCDVLRINESPMRGLTARMVIDSLSAGTLGGAVRLRILSANEGTGPFQTIAASPAIVTNSTIGEVENLEVLVRFGTDWDYVTGVIDTFGSVELVQDGIGLVLDGVKFPDWEYKGDQPYWNDGVDNTGQA